MFYGMGAGLNYGFLIIHVSTYKMKAQSQYWISGPPTSIYFCTTINLVSVVRLGLEARGVSAVAIIG